MLRGAEWVCCAGRSTFGRRAEPERSEGGWSEAQPNGEGVASGSATLLFKKKISLIVNSLIVN